MLSRQRGCHILSFEGDQGQRGVLTVQVTLITVGRGEGVYIERGVAM